MIKILTYYNVFVNNRHDFQNYCVWIAERVHLLPRFKFNQDKKIVIVYDSDSFKSFIALF